MDAKVDEQTLSRIQVLFGQFELEILESNYSTNSKSHCVGYVRRFVQWLEDNYSPHSYGGPS